MKLKLNAIKRFLPYQLVDVGLISLGAFFIPQTLAAEIGSQSGTNITVNDGSKVIADASDVSGRYGVMTSPGNDRANVNLGNNVTVSVTDPTNFARGIILGGSNSTLTANHLTVDVAGARAVGINLSGANANADLGAGSIIKSSGKGISVENNASLSADGLSIESAGANGIGLDIQDYGSSANLGSGSQIKTTGRGGTGVFVFGGNGNAANGDAHFTAKNLMIDTQGDSAFGVNMNTDSAVDLGSGSVIHTSGVSSHGIWGFGKFTADALMVDVKGSNSNGIEVRDNGTATIGAGSHIASAQGGGLVTSGKNATINYIGTAEQRNSVSSGGSYGVSAQSDTAVINIKNTDIAVDRNGSLALGLWTRDGGTIKGENLSITGAEGARGIYAMTNSQIDLTNDLVINMATPDQMAIATQHNDGYTASRINASGHMLINGSVLSRGGAINLDMSSGSVWTGSASSDNVNGGKLDVAMNNSVWNVTSDATLDKLALTNSTVDFASHASSPGAFTTLNVANLSGNSTFVMRADVVGEGNGVNNAGDLLNVTGSSAGDHVLNIRNQGSEATTGNEVLTVVQTTDGVASFTAASKVELGGYMYDVRKNGTNWELYASGTAPAPLPDPTPDPDPKPDPAPDPDPGPAPSPKPTTTADAGGNYLNVGYLMNYEENRTLLQRMGDLRDHSQKGNIWLRGYGGKFDSFGSGKLSGFDMSYSGIQFGVDKSIADEIPLFIGLFMGSTHASPNYRAGDGTAKSDYAGMYTSYMAQNGFYSDLIVKASRQRNSFHVLDSQNNGVSASGSSSGLSVSLEAGQKFSLNQPGDGFYIEPQAQFTYSHQNGMNMKASNGLDINLSAYESMLGRASVVLGYEIMTDNTQVNMYVKTGGIREFSGSTDYRLNGSREKHSFQGNGWDNGIGVSAQFNKQHTLYLEADYTHGDVFDQKQIGGGYRFSF